MKFDNFRQGIALLMKENLILTVMEKGKKYYKVFFLNRDNNDIRSGSKLSGKKGVTRSKSSNLRRNKRANVMYPNFSFIHTITSAEIF